MRRVAFDLLSRLAAAMLAVGAAVAAVVSVAALADGHLPRPETLRQIALPVAAFLGAGWTLAAWRAEGADLALAGTGRSPTLALWALAAAASLVVVAGTGHPTAERPAWDLQLAPDRVTVRTPDGDHRYRWDATGAVREDGARFDGFPAPTRTATTTPRDRTALVLALRCAVLVVLLGWLGHRRSPPGLALTFGASGGAFALSWLASAWIA